MLILDLVIALAFALLVAWLLIPTRLDREDAAAGKGAAFFFLLILLFPLIWAGGAWIGPVGPLLGGVAWLPFLAVSVFLFLLLFALATPSRPRRRGDGVIPEDADEEAATATAISFGIVAWILVLAAIGAIVAAYLR